ncbi:hypothetical protein GCM10023189_50220 [Nibrella saemangeumensis]|uniref:Ferritin-like metal-binding protein YciE n=1 Tax=Nibrella saemangeumensis TaxID=1084526 RepID=A0ABP8NGV7_9BACT
MASLGKQISDFFSGGSSHNDEGLRGVFIHELKAAYYCEKQAVDALGEQADAATTDVVRNAFLQHQEESRNQINRLERVFDSIGVDVDDLESDAIDGLVDDAQTMIAATESGSLSRDAALIVAAQKVEHLEIATYGSLHTMARLLGYSEAANLLEETLREEKNTDRKLTEIAESFINERAKSEGRDVTEYGRSHTDYDRDMYSGSIAGAGTAYSGRETDMNRGTNWNSSSGSSNWDNDTNRGSYAGSDMDRSSGSGYSDSNMNRGDDMDSNVNRAGYSTGSSSSSGNYSDTDENDMNRNRDRTSGSNYGNSNDPTLGGMTGV